jgi:hypothetical protein
MTTLLCPGFFWVWIEGITFLFAWKRKSADHGEKSVDHGEKISAKNALTS